MLGIFRALGNLTCRSSMAFEGVREGVACTGSTFQRSNRGELETRPVAFWGTPLNYLARERVSGCRGAAGKLDVW